EAEHAYLKALAVTRNALGPNHPAIIPISDSLGSLYYRQHRYQEAEIEIKRWISVSEANLPSQRGNLAHGLNNLAQLYKAQGKCDEAIPLFERALAIGSDAPEFSAGRLGDIAHRLAVCQAEQGRMPEAEADFKRALSACLR